MDHVLSVTGNFPTVLLKIL